MKNDLIFFISACEIIHFTPFIMSQAKLELIKTIHSDAPIVGSILLSVDKKYKLIEYPECKENGFIYKFERIENV